MRLAICEDNKQHLSVVGYLLDRYMEAHPGVEMRWDGYAGGFPLLDGLRHGRRYDVFLLDVILPDLGGIAVAEAIREEYPDAMIIFLTASADHALDAFSVSAMQYLLKPVREDMLFPVLDKAVALLDFTKKAPPFFLVATADEIKAVRLSSLVCVESQRRTLMVYLSDGSRIQSKPFRGNFESAIAPLLEDCHFLHAHKSFVLNMDHVSKVTSRSFLLANDMEVFIPRYKFADMKARYFDYVYSMGGGLLGDAPAVRPALVAAPRVRESSVS